MLGPLGVSRGGAGGSGVGLLATGQTTQYNSELDDGYYKKGTVKSYTVNTTGAQAGTTNVDLAHLVNTGISFDAASKELRCTGQCGVFKAGGGETIVVSGSSVPANNAAWTTASATADKVVLTTAPTDESAGASITVVKREAISNNTVLDNVTGLTWLRYVESKFGILGTGLMPWTGQVYDIFAYCAAANAASLGGYTDWRVANTNELLSLADYEPPTAAPDSSAFPGWPTNNFFWLSSTSTYDTSLGKLFSFSTGNLSGNTKTSAAYYTALVRGG